uniref:Uncharacterized protein n=1 Tax=Strongyloides venezuelensis TaxID=75913 RepID=A0A0K0FXB2_STRVS
MLEGYLIVHNTNVVNDKNDLNRLLEEAISSTATFFMNSIVSGNESTSVAKNVTKSKETKKLDSPKQLIDGNETPIITKKTGNSEQKRKFFLNTIILINTMSFEYEKENNSSKVVEAVKISSGARLPKQKYNIPLPSFDKNKTLLCPNVKKKFMKVIYLGENMFLNNTRMI